MLQQKSDRKALILYGSETGNAQDVAAEVGRITERLHFGTSILDLDSVQLPELVKPTIVIFVVSTAGQGEFPQNARAFWKRLLSSALKPGVLRKLRFTSFGLGDSSYPQYNVAHRALYGRLVQLRAQPFCDRGEGNEQHPEGHGAGFREWIQILKQKLTEAFLLPNGLAAIPDNEFVEPPWKLKLHDAEAVVNATTSRTGNSSATSPSLELLPVKGAHKAEINRNERITPIDHFQDVRVLDLRIEETVDYTPGAVAVVYPKNFAEDIDAFIKLMEWESIADRPLELIETTAGSAGHDHPSPLRHLDLTSTTLTVRWLLENVLDIMSIPRRSFFTSLSYFAGTSNEDKKYQKERLLELANPELIDELWDYTTRPKRTILEVMMDFTTIKVPWQYALSTLPLMRGRQFSIASGGALKRDEQGRTRIQLLIAIVDPPSPIIKWRRRYGVCTRYIAQLPDAAQINISVQPGYLNLTPDELNYPAIMIGPGTGLAPMRSMVQERLIWAANAGREAGAKLAGDILFYGCRSSQADYFFQTEFEHLRDTEALRLHVAFSRDAVHPRQYVQDCIRALGATVCDVLTNQHGKLFVCGSSGNMPKGVRQAILDVLVAHSAEIQSEEQATAFLEAMEKSGRYKQETW